MESGSRPIEDQIKPIVVLDAAGLKNRDLIRTFIERGITTFIVATTEQVFKEALPPLVLDALEKSNSLQKPKFLVVGPQTPDEYVQIHADRRRPIIVISKDPPVADVALNIKVQNTNREFPRTELLNILIKQFKNLTDDVDKLLIATLFKKLWQDKSIFQLGREAPDSIKTQFKDRLQQKQSSATENWKKQNANLPRVSPNIERNATVTMTRGDRTQTRPIEVIREEDHNNQLEKQVMQDIGKLVVENMKIDADPIIAAVPELEQRLRELQALIRQVTQREFFYHNFNEFKPVFRERLLIEINDAFLKIHDAAKNSKRAAFGAFFSSAIYSNEQKEQIEILKQNFIKVLKSLNGDEISPQIKAIITNPKSVVNVDKSFAFGKTTTRDTIEKHLNPARR